MRQPPLRIVGYMAQVQSVRRKGRGSQLAVALQQHLLYPLRRIFPLCRHTPGNRQYFAPYDAEKAPAVKSKIIMSPCRVMSSCDKFLIGDLAWHSAARKALKSCSPNRYCAGLAHLLHIQWRMEPASLAMLHSAAHRTVNQHIAVTARLRGKKRA